MKNFVSSQRIFGIEAVPKGNAGGVTINTPNLTVTDGARVSVRNEGIGNGGTLAVNADSIRLDNGGSLTATTNLGEGGNIAVASGILVMRRGSSITTTAAGTVGSGGNITINSPIVVGLENSDIIANAVRGNGGNIQVNTQGIFGLQNRSQQTQDSDITASSQLGVSGTINVSVLNFNQQNVVAPPPNNFVTTDQVVGNSCLARQGNSQGTLAIAGNGGLPETPETGTIPYQVVQVRPLQTQATQSSFERSQDTTWKMGDPIIEATEFSVNAQGQMVLTAKGNSVGEIAHPHPIPCQPN
jgi:large exoprotein involved in heme utilization and adhesion